MRFHFRPIVRRNVYVADTAYVIGFELIVFGRVIKPTVEITTPKGHMHR